MDLRPASARALEDGHGVVVPHPVVPDAPQFILKGYRGWCESPVPLRQEGNGGYRLDFGKAGTPLVWEPARTLQRFVHCRKCPACLRWRRADWSHRAKLEYAQSHRSWMITTTFEQHERYLVDTDLRMSVPGFDAMSEDEQHLQRVRWVSPLLTNMFKRLREGGLQCRYLWVAEKHKVSRWAHFHALLHETEFHAGSVKRRIEAEWRDANGRSRVRKRLGFVRVKKVDDAEHVGYVTKYLGKEVGARLRASLNYGRRLDVPVLAARALSGAAMPLAALAADPDAEAPVLEEVLKF